MRVKSGPSTAQRLGIFREECRAYYAWVRDPEKRKPRVEPTSEIFKADPYARSMADRIKSEELDRHNKILKDKP